MLLGFLLCFWFGLLTSVTATAQTPSSPLPRILKHRVQKGDTLYSLGKKYGIPVKKLLQQNGNSETIRIGQVLTLEIPQAQKQIQPQGVHQAHPSEIPQRFRYRRSLEEILAEEDSTRQPEEEKTPNDEVSQEGAFSHRRKEIRSRVVRVALSYRGTPYVRAGESPSRGFDCSGFTRFVYRRYLGINIPHNSRLQFTRGKPVPFKALKPGDLLFFKVRSRGINHVGIYIGDGQFVHAANPRRGVRVDSLYGSYRRYLAGARRLIVSW